MLQVTLGLLLVLVMIGGLAWAVARLSRFRPTSTALVRVVTAVSVGQDRAAAGWRDRPGRPPWPSIGISAAVPALVYELAATCAEPQAGFMRHGRVEHRMGGVAAPVTQRCTRTPVQTTLATLPLLLPIPLLLLLLLLVFLLAPLSAFAEPGISAFSTSPAAGGGTNYTLSLQTLLFMTALGFLPAVLLMMTSFTRIVIVLSLLRQALGTQHAPPNQVIVGLSLFLSFFVMGPTLDRIYVDAWQPLQENRIGMQDALARGTLPLKQFMLAQTRASDLALYVQLSGGPALDGPEQVPLQLLVPAFITSELKTAFQIGFAIFIPFLIIDMVVASVLMALGMMMVSPAIVSLPFKLILFVLVDGWALLTSSLAQSFVS